MPWPRAGEMLASQCARVFAGRGFHSGASRGRRGRELLQGRFTLRGPRFHLGTDELEVKPEEKEDLAEAMAHLHHPDAHTGEPASHPVTDEMAHMDLWASKMDLPGASPDRGI